MSNDEKKSTHFSDWTHQECMIFAEIGHGSCYYHWNEIFAGVARVFFYLLLPEFGCRVVVGGCCVGSSVVWAEKPNTKFAVYISYAQIHNSQINEWLGYGTSEIRNLG